MSAIFELGNNEESGLRQKICCRRIGSELSIKCSLGEFTDGNPFQEILFDRVLLSVPKFQNFRIAFGGSLFEAEIFKVRFEATRATQSQPVWKKIADTDLSIRILTKFDNSLELFSKIYLYTY